MHFPIPISDVVSYVKGFRIRGFILISKKNACFLWKIIWFLFHSIAEVLPFIMKNNIIYMTSTATFAGPHLYGQRTFFELKKVSLIQKNVLQCKQIYFFESKKFFLINKTFFNSKKFFLWPYIKEMFLWFKETVSSVHTFLMKFSITFSHIWDSIS